MAADGGDVEAHGLELIATSGIDQFLCNLGMFDLVQPPHLLAGDGINRHEFLRLRDIVRLKILDLCARGFLKVTE